MKQLTKEEAIAFYQSKCYTGWTSRQIAEFQCFQEKLCVPFTLFHAAMEEVLGRSVYTHEFANQESLQKELMGDKEPPTLEEILDMIPNEKKVLVMVQPMKGRED